MPPDTPPPRTNRFGSPLILSRVHWVRPELVAEVKFLTWTDDNLLRQVVYQGLREDKPASEVRRHVPHPKLAADGRSVSGGRNIRRAGRSAWQGRPAHAGYRATLCSAPAGAACRPSRCNDRRHQARAQVRRLPMSSSCRQSKNSRAGPTTGHTNPARVVTIRVVSHTRPTNVRYCRMRPTIYLGYA
jgi:hypothetical protein